MTPQPPNFLDVPSLLELSRPKPRANFFWYFVGGFLLVTMGSAYFSTISPTAKILVEGLSAFFTMGMIGAMSLYTMSVVRRLRESQAQIEAAQELVQLRRWEQAAMAISMLLSRPMRTVGLRLEALICLTSILARYHRFEDAILVQNHLLEFPLDPITERAIKLGRTMSMLQEDQLSDADRAISDLRRGDGRETSAGLALVEIYRDVKTGHLAEAIEMFHSRLPVLRDQLGIRVADAYALTARAFDQLERRDEAARAFFQATLLAPAEELARRYAEVAPLVGKYPVAKTPGGLPEAA